MGWGGVGWGGVRWGGVGWGGVGWGGVGGAGVRRKNMYYVARRVFLVKTLNLGHVNLEFNPKILNFSQLQILNF